MTVNPRARRVEVPQSVPPGEDIGESNFASAFLLETPQARALTPEQWARATFEGAPPGMAGFLVLGWRLVLGLKLGPRPSPTHVQGWPIARSDSDSLTVASRSSLIVTENTVVVRDSEVLWLTYVHFNSGLARLVWAGVTPVHLISLRYLLTRAGRKLARSGREVNPQP